jgi:hypothetical protein
MPQLEWEPEPVTCESSLREVTPISAGWKSQSHPSASKRGVLLPPEARNGGVYDEKRGHKVESGRELHGSKVTSRRSQASAYLPML